MGSNSKEVHLKILKCTVDELEMRSGWPDQVRLKLNQSPAKAGVKVWVDIG